MQVLTVVFMRTFRRLRIKLQRRIIELFESDFARVETSDRVFAH